MSGKLIHSQILLLLIILMPGVPLRAQPNRDLSADHIEKGIDYANIFCQDYTAVGIPCNGQVYLFRPPYKSDSLPGWKCYDSMPIPPGTIAIDGNIRKTIFITDKAVLFQENERKDTLTFNEQFKKVAPRLWIRGSNTTERDIEFLSAEKRLTYYADGPDWFVTDQLNPYFYEENRTHPLLTEKKHFLKLYNSESHDLRAIIAVYPHKVTFHYYQLTAMIRQVNTAAVKSRTFRLPAPALSAFVYNYYLMGVCFADKIIFYAYEPDKKAWQPSDQVPPLPLKTLQ